MERVVRSFQSRRNDVRLLETNTGIVVQKHYLQHRECYREQKVYRKLLRSDVPHAYVIGCGERWLRMTFLPGKNLVDILNEQEETGQIQWNIWEKLVQWLMMFHRATSLVMNDVNLRNFIYDPVTGTLYGVDFEECGEGSMTRMAALLAAFIRNYAPENTPVKRKIAEYVLREFSCCLSVPLQELLKETEKQGAFLQERRSKK